MSLLPGGRIRRPRRPDRRWSKLLDMRGRPALAWLAIGLVITFLIGGGAFLAARILLTPARTARVASPPPAPAAAEPPAPGQAPAPATPPAPTAAPAPTPAPPRVRPPLARPLWGLWEPGWQTGEQTDFGPLTRVEASLGHRAGIVHWYASWTEGWDYDGGLTDQVVRSGRTPMITWEAWDRPLAAISAGRYDEYIDSWARGIAASRPQPIYLRIFHEFNDPRDPARGSGYPWSVGGGTANQPADLAAAWRHVHDRFAAAGATNVRFVWSPDGINLDLGTLRAAYPGDTYVDFAGWDTYGYDIPSAYRMLGQVTQKPLILPEVGSTDPAWVRELAGGLASGRYGAIRAVVWFDEGRSRLDGNPAVQAALRTALVTFG